MHVVTAQKYRSGLLVIFAAHLHLIDTTIVCVSIIICNLLWLINLILRLSFYHCQHAWAVVASEAGNEPGTQTL